MNSFHSNKRNINFWQDYWVLKTDIEISLAENVTLTVTPRSRHWPVVLIIKSATTKLSDGKVSYSCANISPVSVNLRFFLFVFNFYSTEKNMSSTPTPTTGKLKWQGIQHFHGPFTEDQGLLTQSAQVEVLVVQRVDSAINRDNSIGFEKYYLSNR